MRLLRRGSSHSSRCGRLVDRGELAERSFTWLRDHEAGISAVLGTTVQRDSPYERAIEVR